MTTTIIILTLVMMVVSVMLFFITRNVFLVIPAVLYKIDSLAACVIFMAVFTPIFSETKGNTQIYRFVFYLYALNYSLLSIDYSWLWVAADIESTIKA